MAAPAGDPQSSVDLRPHNQVPEVIQPTIDDRQDPKVEIVKETSPTSVFLSSEPVREEQVQNAVKFLSHPKVRGSPVMYRRSFLERKGLTKEEIDEAFRRVPDPTPTVKTTEPVVTNQDGQMNSSSNVQPQALTQTMQSNPAVPGSSISKIGTVSRFHWSHVLLAVGFLAASGAGTVVFFKNAIIPRLKSWIRKVVLEEEEGLLEKNNGKPSVVEEASIAAKTAAASAADVARACQQMLTTKSEERKFFEELIRLLNLQINEMKLMRSSIQKLESGQSISARIAAEQCNDLWFLETSSRVNQSVSNPLLAARPKPWEVSQAPISSTNIYPTQTNQLSANDALPWWHRKNSRITEIESAYENKLKFSDLLSNDRSVQRSWVPPVPPPVTLPEAAEAVRKPSKPSYQKEQIKDDQLLETRSPNEIDELQTITKISELGGNVEDNGKSLGVYSGEIQNEENGA